MEPEDNAPATKIPPGRDAAGVSHGWWQRDAAAVTVNRVLIGCNGLRAGWSILFFGCLFYLLRFFVGTIFVTANLVDENSGQTAASTIALELIPFFAMIGAAAAVARIENRSIFSYNLTGPRRFTGFIFGAVSGFAALSALMAVLAAGGWMRLGPATLSGVSILRFAALWGMAFLLVGCVEEGLFRCYLLSTLTRGLNFRWALAAQAALCSWLFLHGSSNRSAWGVYLIAALGLVPCFALHRKAAARSAFWQAAWVTSTGFGLIHTFNHGENLIGIFAAAAIGFAWCASVRVTGSAFWAIGCHAAWDWGETFFYGTADSGLPAHGHLLTTTPAGNPLLSGGADGPEGSALVLGAVLLLFALMVAIPGRKRLAQAAPLAAD